MAEFVWPEPKPITYRLYYNTDGSPCCYTMEDLPGDFIEVDQQTYINHRMDVRVVEGKLIKLKQTRISKKLTPSESGTACDPRDVCVVVADDRDHTKWSKKTYEIS